MGALASKRTSRSITAEPLLADAVFCDDLSKGSFSQKEEWTNDLPLTPEEDTEKYYKWACQSLVSHTACEMQDNGWIIRAKAPFHNTGYAAGSTYYFLKFPCN